MKVSYIFVVIIFASCYSFPTPQSSDSSEISEDTIVRSTSDNLRDTFIDCSAKCSQDQDCIGIVIYKRIDSKFNVKTSGYFCRTESTDEISEQDLASIDPGIVYKIIFKVKTIQIPSSIQKIRTNRFRRQTEQGVGAGAIDPNGPVPDLSNAESSSANSSDSEILQGVGAEISTGGSSTSGFAAVSPGGSVSVQNSISTPVGEADISRDDAETEKLLNELSANGTDPKIILEMMKDRKKEKASVDSPAISLLGENGVMNPELPPNKTEGDIPNNPSENPQIIPEAVKLGTVLGESSDPIQNMTSIGNSTAESNSTSPSENQSKIVEIPLSKSEMNTSINELLSNVNDSKSNNNATNGTPISSEQNSFSTSLPLQAGAEGSPEISASTINQTVNTSSLTINVADNKLNSTELSQDNTTTASVQLPEMEISNATDLASEENLRTGGMDSALTAPALSEHPISSIETQPSASKATETSETHSSAAKDSPSEEVPLGNIESFQPISKDTTITNTQTNSSITQGGTTNETSSNTTHKTTTITGSGFVPESSLHPLNNTNDAELAQNNSTNLASSPIGNETENLIPSIPAESQNLSPTTSSSDAPTEAVPTSSSAVLNKPSNLDSSAPTPFDDTAVTGQELSENLTAVPIQNGNSSSTVSQPLDITPISPVATDLPVASPASEEVATNVAPIPTETVAPTAPLQNPEIPLDTTTSNNSTEPAVSQSEPAPNLLPENASNLVPIALNETAASNIPEISENVPTPLVQTPSEIEIQASNVSTASINSTESILQPEASAEIKASNISGIPESAPTPQLEIPLEVQSLNSTNLQSQTPEAEAPQISSANNIITNSEAPAISEVTESSPKTPIVNPTIQPISIAELITEISSTQTPTIPPISTAELKTVPASSSSEQQISDKQSETILSPEQEFEIKSPGTVKLTINIEIPTPDTEVNAQIQPDAKNTIIHSLPPNHILHNFLNVVTINNQSTIPIQENSTEEMTIPQSENTILTNMDSECLFEDRERFRRNLKAASYAILDSEPSLLTFVQNSNCVASYGKSGRHGVHSLRKMFPGFPLDLQVDGAGFFNNTVYLIDSSQAQNVHPYFYDAESNLYKPDTPNVIHRNEFLSRRCGLTLDSNVRIRAFGQLSSSKPSCIIFDETREPLVSASATEDELDFGKSIRFLLEREFVNYAEGVFSWLDEAPTASTMLVFGSNGELYSLYRDKQNGKWIPGNYKNIPYEDYPN